MQALAAAVETPDEEQSHELLAGMDEPVDRDVSRIVVLFREAGRALRSADPANWAAGLTMPQVRMLFFLGRAGAVSVGEVAAGLGVAQPSATETLDKLVRHGLVERTVDATDRRVVRSTLTPAGREMIDRPWETRRAVLATALRRATPDQRQAITRGLSLLCEALAGVAAEATEPTQEGPAG